MNTEALKPLLLADGFWPILVFWIAAIAIGRMSRKKKEAALRARQQDQPGGFPVRQEPQDGGLLAEMRRAMEELKRAEQEQRQASREGPKRLSVEQQQQAREYLQKRKELAANKQGKRRAEPPARLALPDEADQSSEEASTAEERDYDNEAEAIIQARRAVAERRGREEVSLEDLSAAQQARRESRHDVTIGTRAEHDAWHDEIGAAPPPPAAPVNRNRLARFGDGSMKGAIVLGEILGPAGGRSLDG